VIPGPRCFVAGEFDDDDVLAFRPFQDFKTTMIGEKSSMVLLKDGWNYLFVLVQLGRIASLFTNNYSISGRHLLLLGN
jgi:hypothetical protein